jgi:succinate dehydrogenase/fumarate reductase cytochrome b subunit
MLMLLYYSLIYCTSVCATNCASNWIKGWFSVVFRICSCTIVPLFIVVHLFVDMLLSTDVIATLVWLISIAMIADLMLFEYDVMTIKVMWSKYVPILVALILDQYDPFILPQLFVI